MLSLYVYFHLFNLPHCRHEVLIFTWKALLAYLFALYIILHLCVLKLIFADIFLLSPIVSLIFRSCFS